MLERVINSSQLLEIEKNVCLECVCANEQAKISRSLALVLVHDLLCSKGGIAAARGPVKEAVLRHKTRLKADYVRAQLNNSNDVNCKISSPKF